jgi:ATP-dependent DNA helicase RecQ
VNIRPSKLNKAVKFLELESPSPVAHEPAGYVRAPVGWTMPIERIERITELRRQEQARMNVYLTSDACLMQFLADDLNDPQSAPCGKCANCTGRPLGATYPPELAEEAADFLERLSLPIEPRKRWPQGETFEGERGRIPERLQAQEGRALCKWGDAGYGELVRNGKNGGQFPDRLVEASADLIVGRWRPTPLPEWVTCVPSLRHRTLVPDFARRLATRLQLPFVDCIRKVRATEPQKTRENSFQQVQNLEHTFEIDTAAVRQAAVLVVDDLVDSRWTFTVVGTKLLQAGSGPVFPFALADSSSHDGE